MSGDDPLLAVEDLRTHVHADGGVVRAVDGVSFDVRAGETVCLVGESGSGKTLTCDSVLRLEPEAAELSGSVTFDGRDLLAAGEGELRALRGDRLAYVFQNARAALDPVYTVGDQIIEGIRFHRDVDAGTARRRAVDLLRTVGLSRPDRRVDAYPHELSDGMCQRVALAVALAADPDLVVADEPTSALDVTIQARIVELLSELRRERDLALLLVTHDLRVVAALADRVVVLYAGRVMERGPVEAVFERPAHPYTQALFRSFGDLGDSPDPRVEVTDEPPPVEGCRFRRECPHAVEACREDPPLEPVDGDERHRAACVYHGPGFDASTVLDDADALGTDREVDRDRR